MSATGGLHNLHNQHDSGPETLNLIKARGFIGELYTLKTADDAAVTLFHLINPLADQKTLNRYPVFVHHGIGGDSAQMLSHSELSRPRRPVINQTTSDPTDTCLAFTLANNNFDVWLIDARGVGLNNHKISVDINPMLSNKYWNFTLDDEALVDLPAAINFVLDMTHEDKVHYISFSQSTLFMFLLLSHTPEFGDKLASFVALAPVAYLDHTSGVAVPLLAPFAMVPDNINMNGLPQPVLDSFGAALKNICQVDSVARTFCLGATGAFSGVSTDVVSHGLYSEIVKGTSVKKIKHMLQILTRKYIAMYDFGVQGNMAKYGRPTPPVYDLSRIKLPRIILFRGGRDLLADLTDQLRLIKDMGVKPYRDFYYPDLNHYDFIVSRFIVERVNRPATEVMFALLKELTAPTGSFLRDPAKMLLPKPSKPDAVSTPDGSRTLLIKSNLINNLVSGISESLGGPLIANDGGFGGLLTPSSFTGAAGAANIIPGMGNLLGMG